jgi:hypothetical protein
VPSLPISIVDFLAMDSPDFWTNAALFGCGVVMIFLILRGLRGDIGSFILGLIMLSITVFAFATGLTTGAQIPGITYKQ